MNLNLIIHYPKKYLPAKITWFFSDFRILFLLKHLKLPKFHQFCCVQMKKAGADDSGHNSVKFL